MTIADVARAAGVSPSTVSRVINGNSRISDETSRMVKQVMKELGYVPLLPRHRRGPKPKKKYRRQTGNIGVLSFGPVTRMEATHFSYNLMNISNALTEHGLNMIYSHVSSSTVIPPSLNNMIDELDGVIVLSGSPYPQIMSLLGNLPTVYISTRHTPAGDHIIAGHEQIGQMAARYLIDKGHRHVAYLNIFPDHPALRTRGEGFHYAAYHGGAEQIEMLVPDRKGSYTGKPENLGELEKIVKPVIGHLIKLPQKPTGMFIAQDMVTAAAYTLMYKHDIRPGRDIEVISAEGEDPYLAGLYPRPTTISCGEQYIGQNSVDLLLLRIRSHNRRGEMQISIKPRIIEGEIL